MITGVIIAAIVVGVVGILVGVLLGVASEKFAIEVDPREIAVREALPGNNCGGCGYPGCDGLAKAIACGEAEVNRSSCSDRRNYGCFCWRERKKGRLCSL